MLYLLAAFWQWFAVALFIGLVVGFLTTTLDEDWKFAGKGAVVTVVFVVAGGFLLANLQTVPGRAGLALEAALLIVSAYGLGLPLGGGARLLTGSALPAAPAKKKPQLVVVRGKPREETAPPPPEPARAAETPAREPARQEEPPARKSSQIATPAPAPIDLARIDDSEPIDLAPPRRASEPAAEIGKKLPGLRPDGLSQPRGGTPDDLAKIKGVGPKSVEKLHALGIFHFDQIATWTPENVKYLSASLAVPGRIERGRWVAQARELAGSGSAATESDHASAPAK